MDSRISKLNFDIRVKYVCLSQFCSHDVDLKTKVVCRWRSKGFSNNTSKQKNRSDPGRAYERVKVDSFNEQSVSNDATYDSVAANFTYYICLVVKPVYLFP